MKKLPLTKGKVAIVDDSDYKLVSRYKWWYHPPKYARTYLGEGQYILMHRLVLNKVKDNVEVDHINGNGLDNRKSNLRACSHKENSLNRTKRNRNNTSGYRGIWFVGKVGRWRASIMINGKANYLGYFSNKEDAIKEHRKALRELAGEFGEVARG